MQRSVQVIERLKQQLKRNARMIFAAQERQRLAIESQLEATEDALDESRQQPPEEEVLWLAEQHSHRLRLELRRRQECDQLVRQSAVVEQHRDALRVASQEARLMEILVEKQQNEDEEVRKRRESTELDALGMARWVARCA
jgi:flagellar biosynthesis chaperone FliJ